jgi:hypothetical protein
MSSNLDYGSDPEKIWKASLIKHQNEISFMLFFRGNATKTWELLRGWIGSLNKASQEKLAVTVRELEAAIFQKKYITCQRTYQIFDELSAHVYEYYLIQNGYGGIIGTATLKPTIEAPKMDIQRREKATL